MKPTKESPLRWLLKRGWENPHDITKRRVMLLLVGVFDDGTPKYYTTDNREGAITTRTDRVHTDGVAGLDLNGENMIGGVWGWWPR